MKKIEDITISAAPKPEKPEEVRVPIMLPKREQDDVPGLNVDQFEHVTISNALGENTTYIKRGKRVDVTIPVFTMLKLRYPDI